MNATVRGDYGSVYIGMLTALLSEELVYDYVYLELKDGRVLGKEILNPFVVGEIK